MARKVTVGLIQASTPFERGLVGRQDQATRRSRSTCRSSRRRARRACRSSGCRRSSTALLLPEPGPALVRRRRARARPDHRADAGRSRKKHQMVMVVPVYEREQAGVYYNTAAVIDADGTYLGKYRKTHIPHTSGFWEKYFFKPGNLGLPGLPDALRQGRRLHLLRPPLPRGRARAGPQRRRDRVQPVGHRRGALAVPLEARAAGARGGQRLLRRRAATASAPRRPGTSASSTARATSSTRAGNFLAIGSEDKDELVVADLRPRPDRGGPPHLAVLPRPPARDVR